MPNRSWFYANGGQQQGPLPEAQFRDLIARGIIRADTLIWTDGMSGWQKAGDIPGLLSPAARPPAMPGRAPARRLGQRIVIDRFRNFGLCPAGAAVCDRRDFHRPV